MTGNWKIKTKKRQPGDLDLGLGHFVCSQGGLDGCILGDQTKSRDTLYINWHFFLSKIQLLSQFIPL